MVSLTESYALVYFVGVESDPIWLGILSTLPILLGAVAQAVVPFAVATHHRWKGVMVSVVIQVLGLLLLVTQTWAFHNGLFLLALTLYWVGGSAAAPLWVDWISDWLPRDERNTFLSTRSGFINAVMLIGFMGASGYLYWMDRSAFSYFVIFLAGSAARVLSLYFLSKHPPRVRPWHRPYVRSADVATDIPFDKGPLASLIVYFFMLKFTVSIASPFFLPYMLQHLKLSIVDYSLITAAPFLTRWIFLTQWGPILNRMSKYTLMLITYLGIGMTPWVWTLSNSVVFLIAVELFSGFVWAGFEMSSMLAIYSVEHKNPGRVFGLVFAMGALGGVLGGYLGGWLLTLDMGYQTLFELNSGMRLLVLIGIFVHAISTKILPTSPKYYRDALFTVLSIRPSFGNIHRLLPRPRK
jgi:MFS family permease